MAVQKVCYYAITKNKEGEARVRFGVCLRKEAQIDTRYATWEKISALIVNDGYRLVEIKKNGTARVG